VAYIHMHTGTISPLKQTIRVLQLPITSIVHALNSITACTVALSPFESTLEASKICLTVLTIDGIRPRACVHGGDRAAYLILLQD
jgi:hypothetical protein